MLQLLCDTGIWECHMSLWGYVRRTKDCRCIKPILFQRSNNSRWMDFAMSNIPTAGASEEWSSPFWKKFEISSKKSHDIHMRISSGFNIERSQERSWHWSFEKRVCDSRIASLSPWREWRISHFSENALQLTSSNYFPALQPEKGNVLQNIEISQFHERRILVRMMDLR